MSLHTMATRPLAVCVGIGVAMFASVQMSRHNRQIWKRFQRSSSTSVSRTITSSNPFVQDSVQPQFLECVQQLQRINPSKRSKHSITVVQYNILASNLATRNHFPYVADSSLDWNVRKWTLLRQLEVLNADVVCLEELSDYWTFFKPELLELGYDSIYMKRPSIHMSTWSGKKKQDGCGIFYKKDKFELKECECINFHDPHDRVAVLALLKMRQFAQYVVVGCTHLWWNAKRVDHQMAELFELEEEVLRMNCEIHHKYGSFLSDTMTGKQHIPIIICGDFNNSPHSPLYEYMENSFMQKPDIEGVQEPFESAYALYKQNAATSSYHDVDASTEMSLRPQEGVKDEPPHTTVNFRRCWTIDYIWYSQHTLVPRRILDIPSEAILRSEEGPANWFNRLAMEDGYSRSGRLPTGLQGNHNGIPNSQFGSDHVPIMAEFEFVQP